MTAKLKKAIEKILFLNQCELEGVGSGMPTSGQWMPAFDNLQEEFEKSKTTYLTEAEIKLEYYLTLKKSKTIDLNEVLYHLLTNEITHTHQRLIEKCSIPAVIKPVCPKCASEDIIWTCYCNQCQESM